MLVDGHKLNEGMVNTPRFSTIMAYTTLVGGALADNDMFGDSLVGGLLG